ncbi:hypothetical protein AK830_g8236 [Neonectria ditissima]|uniref:Linalool dehydratase/isomerase domain-containing protein n=1 Tax=Neonectria ditissima TaxID=78410 RepID=A0A0P7AV07_9HYPO|nr:hypothetical protein AK830_g8236 [Neonectria ditissima]
MKNSITDQGVALQDAEKGVRVKFDQQSSQERFAGIREKYVHELIPPNVAKGAHRRMIQFNTLLTWSTIASVGVAIFYQPWLDIGAKNRAAALSVVFPGAGYLASPNVISLLLFSVTWITIPFALFAWFGGGAITFPLLIWALSIIGAHAAARQPLWEPAGSLAPGILALVFLGANRFSANARSAAVKKQKIRNAFIPEELARLDQIALNSPTGDDRELDIDTLRELQFLFDHAFQDLDDWSGFTCIDQFQTSSIRYQIYEMMYCLGLYQGVYAPNAHGYVSEAFKQIIERSLTKKVLNYWKWERLSGKLTTDWDPILQDNIMVTGFLLHGVMLYTANTGDLTYTEPGSLNFHITDSVSYKYNLHDLQEALVRQWSENPYCLYPCEPNWIYVMCNLQGMTGSVIYDRFFKTRTTDVIKPIFEASLNSNFTEASGSVIPIRSELTGFSIPGLCGALGDLAAVILSRGTLDNLSRRLWAIFRRENVRFDEKTGDLSITGLVGADKIDTGNYKPCEWAVYPYLALSAGDHGEEKLQRAAIAKLRESCGRITTPTGAKRLDPAKASTLVNYIALLASLVRVGDYKRLVQEGPSETTLRGPILSEVPYPGVLIAKARSHTSKDLKLVLYPSGDGGTFTLGISRLAPKGQYRYGDETVSADEHGHISISVLVQGRTLINLVPVSV